MKNECKKTLLLVEDETFIAMEKQHDLKKCGYHTVHAMTGEEAVSVIKDNDDIDMVLMDIDLGDGIDGIRAAELILKDKEIPLVFLSSHCEPEILEKAAKISSYGYVIKSAGSGALVLSIRSAFNIFEAKLKTERKIRLLQNNNGDIQQENDLSIVMNSLGDAVITTDIEGNIVRINPVAEKLTGWKIINGRNISLSEVFNIINVKTMKTVKNAVEKVLESGQIEELSGNSQLISREGNKFQVAGIAIPIRTDAGNIIRVVIVFREVSEEYQLQKELNKYDTRYKFAVKGSALGLWDWNIAIDEILFSKQSRTMLDLHENIVSGSLKEWNIHFYPGDRKTFHNNMNRYLCEKTSLYQDELRVLCGDNSYRWILARGMVVSRTEDGTPDRMLGTIVDVTGRRQAEENLRIERDNLNNIFSSMKDGVVIISQEYDIQYLNPAVKQNFGDLYGKKCYEYFHQRIEKCPGCVISKVAAGEKINKEFNSQISHKTYDVMSTPIKNTDGSISMLEILRDITARKKAEEEIKNQLLEKEIVLKETHHRIKNNFASIVSLLSIQAGTLTNYEAVAALNDAIGRVKSMQILYEKLLLTDNYSITSLKLYLDNLTDEIVGLFPDEIELTVIKQIDDISLDQKRLVSFGIIVNELLTNVMKYAFDGRAAGLIKIRLNENYGMVTLTIQDDGNGLPSEFELEEQTGFGLMLVKMLTKQFNGDFIIENHKGTRSVLRFNL